MQVSIVIVNYKTPDLLHTCVNSIVKHTKDVYYEIIVVDNDSQDDSKDVVMSDFPSVKWLDMGYNAGFGRANNKGIENSTGEFVLLLNSDTELYENSILKTLNHYLHLERSSKVGLLGCQVMHQDGRLQPSCNYYWAGLREVIEEHPFGIKILQHWLKIRKLRSIDKYAKLNSNHEITWLGVPYALIRRDLMIRFPFDKDFFMYSEDEELNFRLSKAGYKPFLYAETGVFHHIGASSGNSITRAKQIFFSKLLFIYKSRGSLYFKLYCFLLASVYKWNKKLAKTDDFEKEMEWLNSAKSFIPKLVKDGICLNCYSGELGV